MQVEWRWEIQPDESRRGGIRKLEFEEGQKERKRDWNTSPRDEHREQREEKQDFSV